MTDTSKVNLSERFKFGKTLGKGSFATVVEATDPQSNSTFAMKVIEKAKCKGQEEHIIKEITILKKLVHKNIIRLFDVYETKDKLYLQMELVSGGELFDRIVNKGFYTEADAKQIMADILGAIKYLHDQDIVHRDLKPENLLMESDKDNADIKLADFGLATVAEKDNMLKTSCGTLTYVAPEILRKEKYGKPVDMWALGVITYILLSGYPPFWAEDDAGILELTLRGKFKYFSPEWDEITPEAKDFINRLIIVSPAERMSVDQAMAHPWIAKECTAKANLGERVGDNLVKNFNAKRKLKAGFTAVRTAIRMGSFPLKHAETAPPALEHIDSSSSIVRDSRNAVNVEPEAVHLGSEATSAQTQTE